ncbi:DUF1697 domain-containing protein [Sphingomonas sp. CCH5-D11]|uniref:DUF1697 domain-containing protein n=1 Tax=Sphingomonas sp. CCH5-D11 TaxID=1768786 RepID=UPI000834FE86|nr:DUF1697 domain-containing protein [Sphingomonas sp. CCH5-D11]
MRLAVLARAINAGKPLAMADLRALLERHGLVDVRTILASGNAVFSSDEDAALVEKRLEQAAQMDLNLETAWFVRSHDELSAIVAAAPFPEAVATRPNHVQIFFHHESVDGGRLQDLTKGYDGPERLLAIGRELYVDYPDGIGRSKLPALLSRAKLPLSTGRNWNTLLKLVEATR